MHPSQSCFVMPPHSPPKSTPKTSGGYSYPWNILQSVLSPVNPLISQPISTDPKKSRTVDDFLHTTLLSPASEFKLEHHSFKKFSHNHINPPITSPPPSWRILNLHRPEQSLTSPLYQCTVEKVFCSHLPLQSQREDGK